MGGDADPDALRALVHDLRTPLTIVEGFSDLLVRRGAELEPEQRDEFAQRIAEAARELRTIIDRADR
jgi:K+-sensing histidine kinase KdpD